MLPHGDWSSLLCYLVETDHLSVTLLPNGDWSYMLSYLKETDHHCYTTSWRLIIIVMLPHGDCSSPLYYLKETGYHCYATSWKLIISVMLPHGDWISLLCYLKETDHLCYAIARRLIISVILLQGDWLSLLCYFKDIDLCYVTSRRLIIFVLLPLFCNLPEGQCHELFQYRKETDYHCCDTSCRLTHGYATSRRLNLKGNRYLCYATSSGLNIFWQMFWQLWYIVNNLARGGHINERIQGWALHVKVQASVYFGSLLPQLFSFISLSCTTWWQGSRPIAHSPSIFWVCTFE